MAHRGQPAGRRRGSDAVNPSRLSLWLSIAGVVVFAIVAYVLWSLEWTLLAGLSAVIAVIALVGAVMSLVRGRGQDFDQHPHPDQHSHFDQD